MSGAPGFENEPLETMVAVGAVTARSARLWVRCPEGWPLRVRCWREDEPQTALEGTIPLPLDAERRDFTASFLVPDHLAAGAAPDLEAGQRYLFAIARSDGEEVGTGTFVTAPNGIDDTPERFSVAVLSCNQPFDRHGRPAPGAEAMLRAARKCLEQHDARLVLTVGDQMYADHPKHLSLFDRRYFARVAPPGRDDVLDCSVDELRRLYHARYRHFFAPPGWKDLHARFPCYPILDDHELVDNWGSAEAHQTGGWPRVGKAARLAYLDYQHSRMEQHPGQLPRDFHYTIEYGPLAAFVLDLRSQRRAGDGGQLFEPSQLEALEDFLQRERDRELVLIVCSVPVVHLPRWAARVLARVTVDGEDFSDRWSSLRHVEDRDRFLRLLHRHQQANPAQRVVLVSGDIHMGCVHEIRWSDGGPAFHQLVSSAITNRPGLPIQLAAKLSIAFTRHVETMDRDLAADVAFLPDEAGRDANPYAQLNLGLIEVDRPARDRPLRMRFLLYGHKHDEPVCVYRSEWIEAGARARTRV